MIYMEQRDKKIVGVSFLLGFAVVGAYLLAPEETTDVLKIMKKALAKSEGKYPDAQDVEFTTVDKVESGDVEQIIVPKKEKTWRKILKSI